MGIRDLAMGQEPKEEDEPPYKNFEGYPRQTSLYDKNKYNENYGIEAYDKEERTDLIEIKLIVTYKELGKGYINEYGDLINDDQADIRAREIAYDRLEILLGIKFLIKYKISKIEATTYFSQNEFDVEIVLTPLLKH